MSYLKVAKAFNSFVILDEVSTQLACLLFY